MLFKLRYIFPIVFVITQAQVYGQSDTTKFIFSDVGWKISIPSSSRNMDTALFSAMVNKANAVIKKTYQSDIDVIDGVKVLFVISDKQYNNFGSSISPYDSISFKTWDKAFSTLKEFILDLLEKQKPALEILATDSGSETIDGLLFDKLHFKTYYPDKDLTLDTYLFCRRQNKFTLSINLSFVDQKFGEQYLQVIRTSKFVK